MAIDPIKGAAPSAVDSRRTDIATRSEVAAPHHHGGGHGHKAASVASLTDQLDLSDTAATLPVGDAVPSGTLSTDQLQQISDRLASGDYNSPDAVNRLADKMLAQPGLLDGTS